MDVSFENRPKCFHRQARARGRVLTGDTETGISEAEAKKQSPKIGPKTAPTLLQKATPKSNVTPNASASKVPKAPSIEPPAIGQQKPMAELRVGSRSVDGDLRRN